MNICALAVRKQVEPAYFNDVYDEVQRRVYEEERRPLIDSVQTLLASIRNSEHAAKVLELFSKDLDNVADQEISDWHIRRRFYLALAEKACEVGSPSLVVAFFENPDKFRLSTYFGKDVVIALGKKDLDPEILLQVLRLYKQARGTADKGVRALYYEIVLLLKRRGLTEKAQQVYNEAKADGIELGPRLSCKLETTNVQIAAIAA